MLLEYFLSSGHSETLTDAKALANIVSSDANKLQLTSPDEFKLALNNSMENRSKYLNNQQDMKYSQSNLLTTIKNWDKLYSTTKPILNDANEQLVLEDGGSVVDESEIASNEIIGRELVFKDGEEMPTDGKTLPDKTYLLYNSITTIPASTDESSKRSDAGALNSNIVDVKAKAAEVKAGQLKGVEVKNADGKNIDGKVPSTVTAKNQETSLEIKLASAEKTIIPAVAIPEQKITNPNKTHIKEQGIESVSAKFDTVDKEAAALKTTDQVNKKVPNNSIGGLSKEVLQPENAQKSASKFVDAARLSNTVESNNEKNSISKIKTDITAVAESERQGQTSNLQAKLLSEQLVRQTNREDVATVATASADSKPVTTTINDPVIGQSSAINTNQSVNRATEISLPVSLPTQQWNQKFAEHVSMLALKGATNAQIQLDPPELGPMSIRIQHSGSDTQIQFQVTNPIARELVDSGMHRLREMLEQHGFDNVDVDVSEQKEREQHASESGSVEQNIDDKIDEISTNSGSIAETIKNKSLIDIFA